MAKAGERHISLRVPEELRQRVEEAARQNRRSLNGELIVLIEESLRNRQTQKDR